MVQGQADSKLSHTVAKNKQHYRVVWIFNGFSENVRDMYDKPYALCKWWVNKHSRDSQYAAGRFKILSITHYPKTS